MISDLRLAELAFLAGWIYESHITQIVMKCISFGEIIQSLSNIIIPKDIHFITI
jgi:hypothetical protein